MKKSHIFLFSFICLIAIQFLASVKALSIVTYQYYNVENSLIAVKNTNTIENDFSTYSSQNFNYINNINLNTEFSNIYSAESIASAKINTNYSNPYNGAIPTRNYNESVLQLTFNDYTPFYIVQNYNSVFNLTDSNYNPFLKTFYSIQLTSLEQYSIRLYANNGSYITFTYAFDSGNLVGRFDSTTRFTNTSFLPLNSTFSYCRISFNVYLNSTITSSISTYYSNGTLIATISTLSNNFPEVKSLLYNKIRFSFINAIGTNVYIKQIQSTRIIDLLTNEAIDSVESTDIDSNSYLELYLKKFNNNNIKNYFSSNNYTIESKTSIKPFMNKNQRYNWISDNSYLMNNASLLEFYLNQFTTDLNLICSIDMNRTNTFDKIFQLQFLESNVTFYTNATNRYFSINNIIFNITDSFFTFNVKLYKNTIQIIILLGNNQYVFTELLANSRLLNIYANNTNLMDFSISKYSTIISILQNNSLHEANYFLEYFYEVAWFTANKFTVEIEFPTISFPDNMVIYDNKNFYLESIFIDTLTVNIIANNSISAYINLDNYISFIPSVGTNLSKNYSYLTSDFLIKNGGIIFLNFIMQNSEDFTLVEYNLTAKYAILFSTQVSLDYYFNLGINILIPIIFLSVFAYGMYSESKSKYLGFFGFMLGIIILYLTNYVSLMYMIFLMIIAIIGLYIILKHEKEQ